MIHVHKTTARGRMKYAVISGQRFADLAEKELGQMLNGIEFEKKIQRNGTSLFLITAAKTEGDVCEKVMRKTAFVDFMMQIDFTLKGKGCSYENLQDKIACVLAGKNKESATFKIETKRFDPVFEENAKSIEVKLGTGLERKGFVADLAKSDIIVYLVFIADSIIAGHAIASLRSNYALDKFRGINSSEQNKVNRAEFKLEEAVEFFGIDLKKVNAALDIGAAPGGWTHYLTDSGVKVVAIDNAFLDYRKLCANKENKTLVITDRNNTQETKKAIEKFGVKNQVAIKSFDDKSAELSEYGLIHIKSNFPVRNFDMKKKLGTFDMLTIDANTQAVESSNIANDFAGLLKSGAVLILTIKFGTRNFERHIETAKKALKGKYGSIRIKKLPHNRREATLFAVRKNGDADTVDE